MMTTLTMTMRTARADPPSTRILEGQADPAEGLAGSVIHHDGPAKIYTVHHTGTIDVTDGVVLLVGHLYTLVYDPETKQARWMAYKLTRAMIDGNNALERRWVNSRPLPDMFLESQDYEGREYQIGHGLPVASVKDSPFAWEVNFIGACFVQTPAANMGPVAAIEAHIRELVQRHGDVSVRLGTLYESPMPPLPAADEPHTVPSAFWFIAQHDGGRACWIVPQRVERTVDIDTLTVDYGEIVKRSKIKEP